MGRLGIRFIVFLLLIQSAFALEVALSTPDGTTYTDTRNVTFTCSATTFLDDIDHLANISVTTNIGGSWAINQTYTLPAGFSGTNISTFNINNIPNGNYQWNCIAGNDTTAVPASSAKAFNVNYNRAPQFSGSIPSQQWNEDASLSNAFDLDTYFSDPDGATLSYSASGQSQITVTIAGDGQVSFSSVANWSGLETVTFTANDGSLSNASNQVVLNVTQVNDAPYRTALIPNMTISKNGQGTISAGDYFADVDNTQLTYFTTLLEHLTTNVSGSTITVIAEPDFVGTGKVVVVANDSKVTTQSNTIFVNIVDNGNKAPEIGSKRPALPLVTVDKGETLAFSITKSDPENDAMTTKWFVNDAEVGETSDSYSFVAENIGNFSVKVAVSDGKVEASFTWTVTVLETATNASAFESGSTASGTQQEETNEEVSAEAVVRCGDGVVNLGENCASCAGDVICGAGTVCSQGACVPKSNGGVVLAIVGVIAALGSGVGFLAYRINSTARAPEIKKDAAKLGDVREKPPVEFLDLYKKEAIKKIPEVKMNEKKEQTKDEKNPFQRMPEAPNPLKETPLQRYVREMRGLGKSDADIRLKLKEKGWKESEIDSNLNRLCRKSP